MRGQADMWAGRLCQLAVRLHLHLRRETADVKRFREIFELHDLGVAMYRQRMQNENPQASKHEINAMVRAWLHEPRPAQFLTRPARKENDGSR